MTFERLFIPEPLLDATGDAAWLTAMLDAERALASAEEQNHVIPEGSAVAIAKACTPELYDIAELWRQGRDAANPAEPLVRALRATAGPGAGAYVHYGATSQDIVDTAAMLVAERTLGLLLASADGVVRAATELARANRDTPIVGRTLLQQAVPTTFGLIAAGWAWSMAEARTQLHTVQSDGLFVQLGGAVGSQSALGRRGPIVTQLFARELGLNEPLMAWHTDRRPVISLAAALATAVAAADRIAADVLLLAQTEIAEVSEAAAGRSSTMPHKRNAVAAVRARACAARARAHTAALITAEPAELQRAAGSWQAEWDALSQALATTGASLAAVAESLAGLEVHPQQMRRNLDVTGGLIMSERVVFAAAEIQTARALVGVASERAAAGEISFRDALIDADGLGLSVEQIDALLDPCTGLEPDAALVDLVLEELDARRV